MRALVLAGGGSRGSWEAGALQYMGESGLFDDGFGFVSGTSVGAINAAGVAMFAPKMFPEATKFLVEMWTKNITKTSDVWKLRTPLGVPALWNPSVGVNTALDQLLTQVVDIQAIQESGVDVRFASVDMISGELVVHTGADLIKHGIKPIMSSASYPLAFPPVEIGDTWLSDGGLRDTAPVGAAIEAGADEIVILTTRDPYLVDPKPREEMGNTFAFGMRCLSLMMHETVMQDVKLAEVYNKIGRLPEVLDKWGVPEDTAAAIISELGTPRVVKVTVLYPSSHLHESLDFSGDVMQQQIKQGYEDARQQLG
jgi:NTE family protein